MKISSVLKAIVLFAISYSTLCEASPYIGVDLQVSELRLKGVHKDVFGKKGPSINVFTGIGLSDSWFWEGGMQVSRHQKNGSKLNLHKIHSEIVGYYALGSKFKLLGGAGISYISHYCFNNENNLNLLRVVPRIMVGGEFKINSGVSLRAGIVSESSAILDKKSERFNNSFALIAGLKYQF